MHLQAGSEVFSQNHAHIDSAKGVDLHPYCTGPESGGNVLRLDRVASAGQYPGQRGAGIGVAEEDHVQSAAPQHSGGGPGCALPLSAIEDFDGHSFFRHDDRRGSRGALGLRARPEPEPDPRSQQQQRGCA